jgi:hypothetical protein
MSPDTLTPNGLPITDTVPLDMPKSVTVPFMQAWMRMLMDAALAKAMAQQKYRGHAPVLLGRRAYARSRGYTNHTHMLRRQQDQEDEFLRSHGYPA